MKFQEALLRHNCEGIRSFNNKTDNPAHGGTDNRGSEPSESCQKYPFNVVGWSSWVVNHRNQRSKLETALWNRFDRVKRYSGTMITT